MRLVVFILLLGIAASAWAAYFFLGGLAEDEEMVIRREFSESVQEIEARASAGDAEIQTQMGLLYLNAHELVRDPVVAATWLERAARQGEAIAQYQFGRLLEKGIGVHQDFAEAARWYGRAATIGGNRDAKYALGTLYSRGLGVENDPAKALQWYREAADGGQPVAQFLIGRMYETGYGVREDKVNSYLWYSLSARDRETVMSENPDYDPIEALDKLKATMNRSQIEAGEKLLDKWRPVS